VPPALLGFADEDGRFWHLSADRGTASSRQLLEVGRTCRRHRRTDAIDPVFGAQRALQAAFSLRAGGTRSLRPAGQYAPRFRTIQFCPKDVGSACSHSPTRLRAAAFDWKLPSSQGEQIMFTHQRPLIRFEILAIISICGLLFVVAFREAGHPLWAIPAMTLFLLSGMMFVYALSKASRRLLQGPQETTLAVPLTAA
jgi:hypothetical protein